MRLEALNKAVLDHMPEEAWSKAVSTHKASLSDKPDLSSTAARVLYALRHGLRQQGAAVFASFTDSAEGSAVVAFP
ncbi:hypothetical protein [Paraburkholderia saeva]|uniref:Uncharacterized protein n=1 Tax=Paraburkholderia saeva TaxID=2777537 RepID=A0A9N8RZD1_9BURK|nr:hypothetical protein [Paraburkholderia saeva]CAG4898581.1 hypothetical protein R52603_02479 [Paraburkholderia saeva]CAG4911287.1 hypothetical protein LMG31841_04050 [Paraburkholderia saeva]